MSRNLPAAILKALKAEYNPESVVVLCEITHPSWAEAIRLANFGEDIVSSGNTFTGFPFELSLPDDSGDVPKGQISIQNVDRRIGQFLMGLNTPPRIRLMVIQTDFPDIYLMDYRRLWLRKFRGDAMSVSADIDTWDYATEPWPTVRAHQEDFPGLFSP